MTRDARIATTFRSHPKRVKLQRRLGQAGPLAILDLILFATDSRPSGVFSGMTVEDIAIAAIWHGDPEQLVTALVETGFLDKTEHGEYALHDWCSHNPYAAGADERSHIAEVNAHVGWLKRKDISCHVKDCELCGAYAERMRSLKKGNAPSPSPSPSEKKKTTPSESEKKPVKPSAKDLIENFSLEPKHREWGAGHCPSVPLDEELAAWKDRCRSNAYRTRQGPIADPQASFYTACRNAEKWGTYRARPPSRGEHPRLPTVVKPDLRE